jgi:hypothetical protein
MHDGTLDHTLKAQGRLGIDIFIAREYRGVLSDELAKILTQNIEVGGTSARR